MRDEPDPWADDAPDPPGDASPAWGHIDPEADGSTWEFHQDEGTFPPGVE